MKFSPLWSSSLHVLGKHQKPYAKIPSVRKIYNPSATELSTLPAQHGIAGVIFDMDGTLVKPCIDFADMRRRIYDIADSDPFLKGNSDRGDVLKLYETFSPSGKIEAKEVFDDIERRAIGAMELMDGVGELCEYLDSKGLRRAVLTRNVRAGIDAMHDILHKEASVKNFHPAVSRNTKGEDGGTLASKPAPDGILHICGVWNCDPCRVIMVGDSSADDIAAASRAGCAERVLLRTEEGEMDNDSGAGDPVTDADIVERQPSMVVSSMGQLLEELKLKYD